MSDCGPGVYCGLSVWKDHFFVFIIILLASHAGHAQGPERISSVELQDIVTRMEQAAMVSRLAPHPYVLAREFAIFSGDHAQPHFQVRAEVKVTPPATRSFQILEHSGSSRGEHIVRRLLQTESKAADSGDGQIKRANYEFALLGETRLDGRRCYLLKLIARREDQRLVNGEAWVDAGTYAIRRIQGDMAKLPSWWLHSVKVTIFFASIDGIWMQTGMTAVAQVRILGKRTFTSRVVSYHPVPAGSPVKAGTAAELGN